MEQALHYMSKKGSDQPGSSDPGTHNFMDEKEELGQYLSHLFHFAGEEHFHVFNP